MNTRKQTLKFLIIKMMKKVLFQSQRASVSDWWTPSNTNTTWNTLRQTRYESFSPRKLEVSSDPQGLLLTSFRGTGTPETCFIVRKPQRKWSIHTHLYTKTLSTRCCLQALAGCWSGPGQQTLGHTVNKTVRTRKMNSWSVKKTNLIELDPYISLASGAN